MVIFRASLLLALPAGCAAFIGRSTSMRPLASRALLHTRVSAAAKDPPLGTVHAQTLGWISNYVIGLNLCPFAKNALLSGGLMVEVFPGQDADDLREDIVEKAAALAEGEAGGTVVVAAPYCGELQTFGEFLELAATIAEDMTWAGLDGKVQLATFHPKYQFEDTEEEDVTNWTNRSPYPLFHLLLEKDVTVAVDAYAGDTDAIWETNQDTMRGLGREALDEIINAGKESPKKTN